jgi:uncharacterized protein YoxC
LKAEFTEQLVQTNDNVELLQVWQFGVRLEQITQLVDGESIIKFDEVQVKHTVIDEQVAQLSDIPKAVKELQAVQTFKYPRIWSIKPDAH